jgi:tetratricopeptide (TPR) repeat protein
MILLKPNLLYNYLKKTQCLIGLKKYNEAIEIINSYIHLANNNVKTLACVYLLKAISYENLNNYKKALLYASLAYYYNNTILHKNVLKRICQKLYLEYKITNNNNNLINFE